MYGNILYGGAKYADTQFGVYTAEVAVDISTAQLYMPMRLRMTFSSNPSTKARIPALDVIINQPTDELFTEIGLGLRLEGGFDEFGGEFYLPIKLDLAGTFSTSELLITGPLQVSLGLTHEWDQSHPDMNAFKWSKIGELNFTIEQDNMAGKAPLPWNGYVYQIAQLANTTDLFVYGRDGISHIKADGVHYGQKQISFLGLKNKLAMISTDKEHYYILVDGEFCRLNTSGNKRIGYKDLFAAMNDIVMTYNKYANVIYICDGTTGYVYDIENNALASGPVNITGAEYKNGTVLLTATSDIYIPDPELTTNVYDFGTKNPKTITDAEVISDFSGVLEVKVYTRQTTAGAFLNSPWTTVMPDGKVVIPCYGKEFKFGIKAAAGSNFYIEELKVNGHIHNFNYRSTLDRM